MLRRRSEWDRAHQTRRESRPDWVGDAQEDGIVEVARRAARVEGVDQATMTSARRHRPHRRAPEQRDELALLQLIETHFEPSPFQRMKMRNIKMMAPRPSTQLGMSVPNIDVFWLNHS